MPSTKEINMYDQDENGKIVVTDPYKGKTYSQVVSLVHLRGLYYEKPHKVRKIPGSGKLYWVEEQGRWATRSYGTVTD